MWLKIGMVALVLVVGGIMVSLMVLGRADPPPTVTEAELRARQTPPSTSETPDPAAIFQAAEEAAAAGDLASAITELEQFLEVAEDPEERARAIALIAAWRAELED